MTTPKIDSCINLSDILQIPHRLLFVTLIKLWLSPGPLIKPERGEQFQISQNPTFTRTLFGYVGLGSLIWWQILFFYDYFALSPLFIRATKVIFWERPCSPVHYSIQYIHSCVRNTVLEAYIFPYSGLSFTTISFMINNNYWLL